MHLVCIQQETISWIQYSFKNKCINKMKIKYQTFGTIPNLIYIYIVETGNIDTNTSALTFLVWYIHIELVI
jgi:hypothetical protein